MAKDEKRDFDAIKPEEKATIIASIRAALENDINSYCSDNDIWRFSVARQLDLKENIDDFKLPKLDNKYPIPYPIRGYEDFADANLTPTPDISDSLLTFNSLFGGGCWHKVDKLGNPVYIDRFGYYRVKDIPKMTNIADLMENHYFLQEFCDVSIMPSCSTTAGKPITKQTVIFDLNGVNISMLYWPALNMLRDMVKNDQLYFPERVHKTFFVNVPVAFVTLWNIVRPWLDPRVVSKIVICGKNFQKILLQEIDAENLPSFLGGTCSCPHMPGGCVPSPPKRNYINLPREAFENLSNKVTIMYDTPYFSTTFSTSKDAAISIVASTEEKKNGKFSKKKTPEPPKEVDVVVVVIFYTEHGRGIIFEALWNTESSVIGAEPSLIFPETLYDSQRSPVVLEIKLPKHDTVGELVLNFRLPRADEGRVPLDSIEDVKSGVLLEYEIALESKILAKYNLPPVNRELR
ncbi:hypothetical protein BB560_003393 [Smittium megazygosporum]|uniref:CRAL-TRIO domain-containing protein n=1 Tax=Smittium megazygosporum TaxID=133381 RepID=A0A2T9ZC38_9FUNG|nr:hypothetical protein BB560_003393 [Smittium megazygosporum]